LPLVGALAMAPWTLELVFSTVTLSPNIGFVANSSLPMRRRMAMCVGSVAAFRGDAATVQPGWSGRCHSSSASSRVATRTVASGPQFMS